MKPIMNSLAGSLPASLAWIGTAWAQADERLYYEHHDMMGGWFGGVLMMLIFIALIVGAILLALRLLGQGFAGRSPGRAIEILNDRFARGEIDRAEYEDRRRALQEPEGR